MPNNIVKLERIIVDTFVIMFEFFVKSKKIVISIPIDIPVMVR